MDLFHTFLPHQQGARSSLLLNAIYEEVLDQTPPKRIYRDGFVAYIRRAVRLGLLNPRFLDLTLAYLSEAIQPERDQLFSALDLETLSLRHLLRDKSQKLIELPQWFWLRIALGLALDHHQPEEQAFMVYESLSQMRLPPSTSTLTASGTPAASPLYLIDPEISLMLSIPVIKRHYDPEPMLMVQPKDLNLFPIQQPELWTMYKQAVDYFWTPYHIDLTQDQRDWQLELNNQERSFLTQMLAFLITDEDQIVENLMLNFMREVQYPEAQRFYSLQCSMENIHAEAYSLMLDTYVKDANQKQRLFLTLDLQPCVKRKSLWIQRLIKTGSFAERLIAIALIEGLFFSSSFYAVFQLKQRSLMPGLCRMNELIYRDEKLHLDFACAIYARLQQPLNSKTLHGLIQEAVSIETLFVSEALPVNLLGINLAEMHQFIQYTADQLLIRLEAEPLFLVQNPFDLAGLEIDPQNP